MVRCERSNWTLCKDDLEDKVLCVYIQNGRHLIIFHLFSFAEISLVILHSSIKFCASVCLGTNHVANSDSFHAYSDCHWLVAVEGEKSIRIKTKEGKENLNEGKAGNISILRLSAARVSVRMCIILIVQGNLMVIFSNRKSGTWKKGSALNYREQSILFK